jgi:hypothetical protein
LNENDQLFTELTAFKEFFEISLSKNKNNNIISDISTKIIKNSNMEYKLKNDIINNINCLNIWCMDKNFIPYFCTNDLLEDFIKECGLKKGRAITNLLKQSFLNNNHYNFLM